MKLISLICVSSILLAFAFACNTFDGQNGCTGGSVLTNPTEWENRDFQTPPRGDPLWREPYQDYNLLQGYVQRFYTTDKSTCNLKFYTKVNTRELATGSYKVFYKFGDAALSENSDYQVTSTSFQGKLLTASAYIQDLTGKTLATLTVDPLDFVWNHPAVNTPSNYEKGQKGSIIELFGWTYDQIEKECPSIGKMGYLGIKVFPPQEAVINYDMPENGELNPWYWVYQPVSFKLTSRHGTVDELRSMINTCRSSNVRVYADAVTNHMTGNGNDAFPKHMNQQCTNWTSKNSTAGSPFYSQGYAFENWTFTGSRPGMEYPAVPYGPLDFHCERSLNSWTDGFILNSGWLSGLADLYTESDYVRQRIADYFTELLSIGFSGFRIDAAKHISPTNLASIFALLKKNLGGGELPDDFITYLEVIIGGEKDLLMCTDNNYCYGKTFENLMAAAGLSKNDISKVKIWDSTYPKEFPICGSWVIDSTRYAIENDCHDDQFPGSSSRDMQDKGSVLVKEKDVSKHRNFEILMYTRTDGNWKIRLLLSSYSFYDSKNAYAPPDGKSDCKMCNNAACTKACTKSVPYVAAYDPNSCGYDVVDSQGKWVEGQWTRTHRDSQIVQAMRKWMGLSTNMTPEELGLPSHCSVAAAKEKFLEK